MKCQSTTREIEQRKNTNVFTFSVAFSSMLFIVLLVLGIVFYQNLQSQINDLPKSNIQLYASYTDNVDVSSTAYSKDGIYHLVIYSKVLSLVTIESAEGIVWFGEDNRIYSPENGSFQVYLDKDKSAVLTGYKPREYCLNGITQIKGQVGEIKQISCCEECKI